MNSVNYNTQVFINHGFAFLLFVIITLCYCWPVLDGQRINQSDYKQFLGMSKEIVDYRLDTGEEVLWTNSMFGGMPAYQISVFYANNILVHIDKLFQLYLPRPIGILFLYFIGFYILLLSLKINPHLSLLGALGFGLSSYLFIILEVGHNTKAHAIAYMAPALSGMIYLFRNQNTSVRYQSLGFLIAFLFLGLHLRANHLQITYYFLFILFGFWINYLLNVFKTKQFKGFIRATLLLVIAGLLAVGINLGSIWSTYDYSQYTTRGQSDLSSFSDNTTTGLDKDYATAYSYGKVETFNLLFPNFVGGPSVGELSKKSHVYKALRENGISKKDRNAFIKSVPLYFGPQIFTAGPVYMGAVIWFFFLIGCFTIKKPVKWVLLGLVVFSFVLAWGKYFPFITNLFLDYFPLYNKFRTVSMILVIAQFSIPLLAILGLQDFLSKSDIDIQREKIIGKSALILTSIALFFLCFSNLLFDFKSFSDNQFPSWFVEALIQDRQNLFKVDVLRSLMFIFLATSILYFFVKRQLFHTQKRWIYLLAFIVLIDMWFVNKRYFNSTDFIEKSKLEIPFQEQDFDRLIKKDTTIYRVYNLNERLDQGARTSYFHHSLGGYHGAKLGRYQEMIDMHIVKGNLHVLNMLNTKYLISSNESGQAVVEENTSALGNAWFVDNINWVSNADQEILSLNHINPKHTVTINKNYQIGIDSVNYDPSGTIKLDAYKPNRLVYYSSLKTKGLAVFSEIFYPKGWNAYIDGVLVEHFPVNYILRGLVIPSGDHEIVFEFKPKSFFISSKIAFCCSVILIISVIINFIFLFKK